MQRSSRLFGVIAGTALLGGAAHGQDCHFEFADVSTTGAQANGFGNLPVVSGNGRYVAFESHASNLVPGDTNSNLDIFVRDLVERTTERVSLGPNGEQSPGPSVNPNISFDGRFVAFEAYSDLDPRDKNGFRDVYLRDRLAGTTEWISIPVLPTGTPRSSIDPSISPDGRYVTFASPATHFVAGDTGEYGDVYLRDRVLETTILISQSNSGEVGDRSSFAGVVSADGNRVAFISEAANFHPSTVSVHKYHLFLRDVEQGTTQLIDANPSGRAANSPAFGFPLAIAPDGKTVAFSSSATDLIPGVTDPTPGPIIWTESRGFTWVPRARLSTSVFATENISLSPDGRYVSFSTGGGFWVAGTVPPSFAPYIHDFTTGVTSIIAANGPANVADMNCFRNSMSWDARTTAFVGEAENLVPNTAQLLIQRVFVRVCDPTPGMNYCYPTKSPVGCLPRLTGSGMPSASLGVGHELLVRDAINAQVGLLFYGTTNSMAMPLGGSLLCVQPPQTRLTVQPTGGSLPPTVDCTGTFSLDFNAWIASGADPTLVPGAPVYAQAWVRDPSHPSGSLLSDAAAFVVGP